MILPSVRAEQLVRRVLLSLLLTEGHNATDTSALVSTTDGTQSPLLMPAMPPSDYIR